MTRTRSPHPATDWPPELVEKVRREIAVHARAMDPTVRNWDATECALAVLNAIRGHVVLKRDLDAEIQATYPDGTVRTYP